MSDYQRFVTYINLYEESSKVKSVGFARIESRGKACDMEIHMRGTGYTGIVCPVYLFVRENDRMLGISVGKIQLTSGNGDCRFSLDRENIGGSGYGLGQICGFLIFVTEKIMFASQWDEKEIKRERFALPEKETRAEKPERGTGEAEREKPERGAREVEREKPERGTGEAEREKPERGTGEAEREKPERGTGEAEPERPERGTGKPEPERETRRTNPEPGAQRAEGAEEIRIAGELVRTNERSIPDRSIQATSAAAQPAEQPWAMKWQFMLENYPVMTPFEGEDEILCIRMELKDLRLLPKRYWYLGNNSFLLHGFFNYRYIILGAVKQNKIKRWFLGVPGVFQSQEKVMAAIFGFPEYKSEKISEQKTGQFGYWYRFLE